MVGTASCTGDGGMLQAERDASDKLIYQVLPSRYGFDPNHLVQAEAIEIVVGQGAKPGTGGMLMPVLPKDGGQGRAIEWTSDESTPCLRCVFPEPPPVGSTPTCDTAGILGPAIAAITAQQAAIALSLLIGRVGFLMEDWLKLELPMF